MLIFKKMIVLISLLAFLGIGALGCEQKGPAEKAGEKVDEAAEQAGEKMEEAGEKMK
jgi:outer membrane lipoprotein-sorting protein